MTTVVLSQKSKSIKRSSVKTMITWIINLSRKMRNVINATSQDAINSTQK